jgi:hypothetical protein
MLLVKLIFTIFCFTTDNAEQEVVAKLVERVDSGVHCGVLTTAAVNKFIIYKDDKPTDRQIKVAIRCIETFDKSFLHSGGLYKLVISDDQNLLKDCKMCDKYHSRQKTFILRKISIYKRLLRLL